MLVSVVAEGPVLVIKVTQAKDSDIKRKATSKSVASNSSMEIKATKGDDGRSTSRISIDVIYLFSTTSDFFIREKKKARCSLLDFDWKVLGYL